MNNETMKGKPMTKWKRVTKYDPALSKALKAWNSRNEEFHLLMKLAVIGHPTVRIPKEKTLLALLRANPREDFLRRLTASNN